MNFKAFIFLLMNIIYVHQLFSVAVRLNKMTLSEGSHVTFFDDQHEILPGNLKEQEQVQSLINFLQKQGSNEISHILLEQALKVNKSISSSKNTLAAPSDYRITYSLDKHIQHAQPSLNVKLDDIEIRYHAGPAIDILNDYIYSEPFKEYKTNGSTKTLGTLTFQDVFDEFEHIEELLAGYYLNQTNETLSDIYRSYIEKAKESYQQLKSRIICSSDVVLDYAREKAHYSKQVLGKKEEDPIANTIKWSFTHLFDLNLLKCILTSDSRNILVFAGGDHTREVINMLGFLEAQSIFQAINLMAEDNLQKESIIRNATISPITGLQIVQALSACAKTETFSPIKPAVCCLAMAVILYYLTVIG